MERMVSINQTLTEDEKSVLLELTYSAIEYGVPKGELLPISELEFTEALRVERATFVTIRRKGKLRGCVGVTEAIRPLAVDVVLNAYAAAFCDSRFSPVSAWEVSDLEAQISLLSPTEQLRFSSENDLLSQLRPELDGIILEEGILRASFLPVMWEKLPDAKEFFVQLKAKAGLPTDYWSENIRVFRYTTESIP